MDSGWVLFAAGLALAATATLLALAAAGTPPLLVAAVAAAGVSYVCLQRSYDRLTAVAYDRVGVERNPDGTVGEAGRAAEPSRSADIDYEPRDDWDDPDDPPFDDPFWTDAGSDDPPGPDEGPTDWWERRTNRREGDGGTTTLAPREREACETLGVDVDADPETVRRAYRERAKETHPDHGGDRETFKRVRWAYEYLQEHRGE